MTNIVSPIFIISLPRSGSTLLQRVLMSHSKISSIAEPQLIMPFVYATKKEGVLAQYTHYKSTTGINNLIKNLPNKEDDYNKFLREFIIKIYSSLSKDGDIYFLDKTPSYFWIIPDLEKIFPKAKFIFLFRNPVQNYASILTSYCNNRFNRKFYGTYFHLYQGYNLLSIGYESLKNKSLAIKYEDFVKEPEKHVKEIVSFLNLDFQEKMLTHFKKQNLKGNLGDKKGYKLYNNIDKRPLEKWKSVFNTKFRQKVLLDYINNIDQVHFEIQGYDKKEILNEIKKLKLVKKHNYLNYIKESLDFKLMIFVIKYNLNIHFSKSLGWTKNHYLS